jgi:hypothetical protein
MKNQTDSHKILIVMLKMDLQDPLLRNSCACQIIPGVKVRKSKNCAEELGCRKGYEMVVLHLVPFSITEIQKSKFRRSSMSFAVSVTLIILKLYP